MTDIVEFLRARLDEDEAAARLGGQGWPRDVGIDSDWAEVPTRQREYVRQWDPARVLAEVEAKRRILDCAEEYISAGEMKPGSTWNDDAAGAAAAEDVLRLMALPYVDHPGYDEAWRPVLK